MFAIRRRDRVDPGAHHTTAIIVEKSSAISLRHCVPVAGREARQEAPSTRLAAFSSRAPAVEFVEAGERGVEVCLVEHFAAADQVAVDRQKVDPRHSASKPSCEVHAPPG